MSPYTSTTSSSSSLPEQNGSHGPWRASPLSCAVGQWLPFCVFQTLTDVSECLSLQPLPGSQYPYNYAGQMGYWYPQGYPPQVQGQQFLGMQGFAYGQYGYQQGYDLTLCLLVLQFLSASLWLTWPILMAHMTHLCHISGQWHQAHLCLTCLAGGNRSIFLWAPQWSSSPSIQVSWGQVSHQVWVMSI